MKYALEISWKEAEKIIKDSLLILPLGSLEQHGPHLPLGVDTFIAEEIAKRVAIKIENSIILPSIPISYSWVWRDFPGTVTIREKTLEELIKDIVRSIYRHKPKALIIINGHLANNSALKYAIRDLYDEIPLRIYYFSYPGIEKFPQDSQRWYNDIHAEEVETSIMLAIKPELVDLSKTEIEYPTKPKSYGRSVLSLGTLSKSGIFGNPKVASREKGEKYLEIIVEEILSTLKEENIL